MRSNALVLDELKNADPSPEARAPLRPMNQSNPFRAA
jgi:hypothetical protein